MTLKTSKMTNIPRTYKVNSLKTLNITEFFHFEIFNTNFYLILLVITFSTICSSS